MNELIQKFAEQATSIVEMVGPQGYTSSYANFDREKFAELIVQGCADIINYRADTCGDRLDSIKANEAVREAQRECAKTIKQHFGVESA